MVRNKVMIQILKLKKETNTNKKHSYYHHAQMGLTLISNSIILIEEYYDRTRVKLG